MELINQSFKIWGEVPNTYEDSLLWIEKAARTCYNSIDKIESGSAEKLITSIMKKTPPHSSVLEHSCVAIRGFHADKSKWLFYDPYKQVTYGNLRAIYEALGGFEIKTIYDSFLSPEYSPKNKRITVELVTDRNVLAEITRHRDDVAFSVESQRYVDYDKGVTFVKPSWLAEKGENSLLGSDFWYSCVNNEKEYQKFRGWGLPPQHARTVLNSQVKTTIVMTTWLSEWEWIFKLRCGSGAYPQMINLMSGVRDEFKKREWMK